MPLTPTDVANKQFRIAFRGYSLDEVDSFLDEVETELTRLLRTHDGLTGSSSEPAGVGGAEAPVAAPAGLTGMEGQQAALRTLLLAQRTADEAIAEARAEADEMLASARAEADELVTSARTDAERTVGEATAEAERTLGTSRERAARLDEDVAAKIQAATGDLDQKRRQLESRIEELRAFEREYRTRLKAYLETQLRELDSGARPSDEAGSGVPADARAAAVGGGSAGRPTTPPDSSAVVPAPMPSAADDDAEDAAGDGPDAPDVAPDDADVASDVAPDDGAADRPGDAPAGPPREAEGSSLRAVPPLAPGAPVGPFTVVGPRDPSAGEAPGDR